MARLSRTRAEKTVCRAGARRSRYQTRVHNFATETERSTSRRFSDDVFDNIPESLRKEIYEWLRENAKDERKPTDSDEQFIYKTRKKAIGPFKKRFWDLPADVKARLAKAYDEKFSFLFTQLAVTNTREIVDRFVKPVEQHKPQPHPDLAVVEAAPDDADLSD